MGTQKTRAKGTGKAGHRSSRYSKRAVVKPAAAIARRAEDKVEVKPDVSAGPDIRVCDHGSVILVTPVTDAASAWIEEHTASDAQFFGPALVVEPRYLDDLVRGMQDDGLVVS